MGNKVVYLVYKKNYYPELLASFSNIDHANSFAIAEEDSFIEATFLDVAVPIDGKFKIYVEFALTENGLQEDPDFHLTLFEFEEDLQPFIYNISKNPDNTKDLSIMGTVLADSRSDAIRQAKAWWKENPYKL